MKYLSKAGSKTGGNWRLPEGARMYGVGGLDKQGKRSRRWLRLPKFVQQNADILDSWKPAQGGGWVDPSGKHWASEWRVCRLGPSLAVERVLEHPRRIDAGGPFCWIDKRSEYLQ
jgi:hypothetical protein